MTPALVIRGRHAGRTFLPDEPLPEAEGTAALIVFPAPAAPAPVASIFDLFGKVPRLRTAEDVAEQLREGRDAWGEP